MARVVGLLLGLLVLVVDGGEGTKESGEGGIHSLHPPHFRSKNNMVDEHSKVVWGKMTDIRRYVSHTPQVTLYEQFVSDVTRGFMNMIQGRKMTVGVLGKVLTGVLEDGKTSKLNQAFLYSPGYKIFMGVFLAWALTMPWIGVFIFFSRNLGYFGGHRYQAFNHNRDVRKRELSCLLASLVIVLTYSCLMGFSSNYHLIRGVEWNKEVLHNHLTDFEIYVDNSIKEIEHVVVHNFEFAAEVIGRDLASIGYLVGEPTNRFLMEGDGISTYNYEDFPTNLETIAEMTLTSGDLLIEAESRLREGHRESRVLAEALRQEADKLRHLQQDTVLCPPPPALCGTLNASLLALEVNFQQIPDFSNAVRNFRHTISNGARFIRTLHESGHSLDAINYRLDDNVRRAGTEKVFLDMARNYQNLCYSKLKVLRQIQKSTGESFKKFRRKIDHLTWDTMKYAVMWWSVGLTVFTLTATVVMLQSVALAIGTFANWTSVMSTKRSKLSDLAGDLLIFASKIIFCISWLMTLTACVLFPVNCVFETAFCQPLMDEKQEAIKALLDDPGSELLAGEDAYFFGELFLNNQSVEMKMSDIINRCALDQSIMKVLKYERVYNVDETVPALANMVSVQQLLSGVNVTASDVAVLKPACLDALVSVRAAVQNNYTSFLDELNKNTLQISLSHFKVELKIAAQKTATRRQARRILDDIASKLEEIRSGTYQRVRSIKSNLIKNFEQLRNDLKSLPSIINTTMEAMERVQQTLRQRGPTLIVPALRIFEQRLNRVVDQYRGQVHNVRDAGKCLSFFEKHQQFVNLAICKKTVSAFNGYWVALMLCVIIMPLCIVVNFKLSRYFHCMEMADQTEIELFDPNALGGLQQGSYNVPNEFGNIPDIYPLNLQRVGNIMANHSTEMKDATNNLLSYFNAPERLSTSSRDMRHGTPHETNI